MVKGLRDHGVKVPWRPEDASAGPDALGRRYLAQLLVGAGQVASIKEAFARYLGDGQRFVIAKQRLPLGPALELVRAAGGIAAWAHPGKLCDLARLTELRNLGLGAVEVEYPDVKRSRQQQIRAWASQLGLAVTGGSDCHGPGPREVGCCSISAIELEQLRERSLNAVRQ